MADTTKFIELPNGGRVNAALANVQVLEAANKGIYKFVDGPTPVADAPSNSNTGKTYTGADGKTYNSAGGTLVDRYATDRSQIDNTFGTGAAPTEASVRAQYQSNAQASIDAIHAKYASIDAADQDTIDLMKRERNASNVLNGLAGSDRAVAQTIDTAKAGEKVKELTAQQQNSEIQSILSNADTRATEEFAKEKQDFIQNSKDKLTAEQALNDKMKTNATNEMKALAASTSFADLEKSNPALIQQYMKETGMDYNTLKATFAASAPAGTYQWDQAHLTANSLLVPHIVNGKVTLENLALPAGVHINDPKNVDVVNAKNGAIYAIDKTTNKVTTLVGATTKTNAYAMPSASKNNLMKFGMSSTDVSNLEKDIQTYGLQKALQGLDAGTTRIIQDELDKTYSVDPNATQ